MVPRDIAPVATDYPLGRGVVRPASETLGKVDCIAIVGVDRPNVRGERAGIPGADHDNAAVVADTRRSAVTLKHRGCDPRSNECLHHASLEIHPDGFMDPHSNALNGNLVLASGEAIWVVGRRPVSKGPGLAQVSEL